MNKAQRRTIIITCFVLGGVLICGAWIGARIVMPQAGDAKFIDISKPFYYERYYRGIELQIIFFLKDIKLYVGIVSIGAGFFFIKKRVKDE